MEHQRASASPRPQFEPISSAMHIRGAWKVVTDGNESICELIASGDHPETLAPAIEKALTLGWPILVVVSQTSENGYRCHPD